MKQVIDYLGDFVIYCKQHQYDKEAIIEVLNNIESNNTFNKDFIKGLRQIVGIPNHVPKENIRGNELHNFLKNKMNKIKIINYNTNNNFYLSNENTNINFYLYETNENTNINFHLYDTDEIDFNKNKKSINEIRSQLKYLKGYKFYGFCILSKILLNFLKALSIMRKQDKSIKKECEILKEYFEMSKQSGERYKFLGKLVTKYPKLMFLNINVTEVFKKRKELNELFNRNNTIYKEYQDFWC